MLFSRQALSISSLHSRKVGVEKGLTASSSKLLVRSGMTRFRSVVITRPNPRQTGQAPTGELKLKSEGRGAWNFSPHSGQMRPRRQRPTGVQIPSFSTQKMTSPAPFSRAVSSASMARARSTVLGRKRSAATVSVTASGVSFCARMRVKPCAERAARASSSGMERGTRRSKATAALASKSPSAFIRFLKSSQIFAGVKFATCAPS